MNFLADEHIDQSIVDRLRQDGHDVVAVAELEPSISDATVLARANQGNALLLTADNDTPRRGDDHYTMREGL